MIFIRLHTSITIIYWSLGVHGMSSNVIALNKELKITSQNHAQGRLGDALCAGHDRMCGAAVETAVT